MCAIKCYQGMCYTTHHTAVAVYLLGFWTSGWSCWGCWGRPASCDGLQDYTTPAEIINIWSYNTKYTQYHVFPIWMQFRPITTNPGGWNLTHAASKTHHTNDWIFSNCCSHYCITGNLTSTLQRKCYLPSSAYRSSQTSTNAKCHCDWPER